MSKAATPHSELILHNAIAEVVNRARTENRTVSAGSEARDILRRFPDATVSHEQIETLILDACTRETGGSVEFGN
jgi:hypothetical protein